MSGRPINESRALAVVMGEKTYHGAPHVACGTTERYVSGGGCVHCGREKATAQRAALVALQTAALTPEPDAAEVAETEPTKADPWD